MSEVDLWLMARFLLQGAGVAVTPQATWPRLCRSISMLRRHRHLRKRFPPFRRITEAVLGSMEDAAAQALFDDWRMMFHAQTMAIMQDRIRPASVTLTLGGVDNLQTGDASGAEPGRGTILWANQFAFQSLWGKRALMQAGVLAHQVSASMHGASPTRFGNAVLNPVVVAAENRYLAGRLVFDPGEAAPVTRRALRILSAGGTVIFTNTDLVGSSFARLPFGATARISMPTTPVALALKYGFALHAVTTLAAAPLRGAEVRISPDLTLTATGEAGAGDRAKADVLLRARDIMLEAVTAQPAQFMGWWELEPHA
jgi:hypothetical protein